jgi:catechol 2,3-dioxygenase-like lactoylglutathione lyase family enzyme
MDQFANNESFWALLVPELSVRNLEQSLRFYRDTLGFAEKITRPEDGFSYLEMGQVQIMLEQIPEDPEDMWQTAPLEAPLGRGINFQIEVQNVRLLHDRTVRAGYEIFEAIDTAWYREGDHENGQEQFLVQDPDGYLLRFMQHLGKRPVQLL